jgi:hypothetical protein
MPPCSPHDRSAACWSELSPTEEFGECEGLESGLTNYDMTSWQSQTIVT